MAKAKKTTAAVTVRASSLPLMMTCANAVLNPDKLLVIEEENETAGLGTMVHAVCENLVKTGELTISQLKDRVSEADYTRASIQINNFFQLWKEASKYMTRPQTEVEFTADLGGVVITGHIDNLHLDPARAFVLDYKTGRQHEVHYHQVAAYSYGAWELAGRPPKFDVYTTVAYLEDNSLHTYSFNADQLQAWAAEVVAQVKKGGYTCGRKCAGCKLQSECPAYRAYVRGAVAALSDDDAVPGKTWEEMTPEERGALIDKLYVVDKAVGRAKLGLRNAVSKTGSLDIGGGYEQVLLEQHIRTVNVPAALPILRQRIGDDAVIGLAKLPLEEVLATFAEKAARGKKGQAKAELLAELDKAGAIVRTPETKMWRRPRGEKVLG